MPNDLKELILEKIKAGMPPYSRWHFAWRAAVMAAAAIAVFALALYLGSWLMFILHANGAWWLPGFGPRGWGDFLWLFPFVPALFIIALIAILALLAERWRFVYSRPGFYVGLLLIVIVFTGSWLVARTSLHRNLYPGAGDRGAPVVGPLYRYYGWARADNVYVGTVRLDSDQDITNNSFDIETAEGERFLVTTGELTRFPFNCCLAPGDPVMIMGDRSATTVAAWGVRKLMDEDDFYGHPMRPPRRPLRRPAGPK